MTMGPDQDPMFGGPTPSQRMYGGGQQMPYYPGQQMMGQQIYPEPAYDYGMPQPTHYTAPPAPKTGRLGRLRPERANELFTREMGHKSIIDGRPATAARWAGPAPDVDYSPAPASARAAAARQEPMAAAEAPAPEAPVAAAPAAAAPAAAAPAAYAPASQQATTAALLDDFMRQHRLRAADVMHALQTPV